MQETCQIYTKLKKCGNLVWELVNENKIQKIYIYIYISLTMLQ